MDRYDEYLIQYFLSPFREGYGKYDGCVLPVAYGKMQQRIYDWKVREQDIWIDTFPKSGENFLCKCK